MKALGQRVKWAKVEVEGEAIAEIGPGLLVLLGVGRDDTEAEADFLADKIIKLRIFADEAGKMNLSLTDVGGAALIVSQFTLFADARRGNRPGYSDAAPSEKAERLYQYTVEHFKKLGIPVASGIFGATMQVSLLNDGPVTILLDTAELGRGS